MSDYEDDDDANIAEYENDEDDKDESEHLGLTDSEESDAEKSESELEESGDSEVDEKPQVRSKKPKNVEVPDILLRRINKNEILPAYQDIRPPVLSKTMISKILFTRAKEIVDHKQTSNPLVDMTGLEGIPPLDQAQLELDARKIAYAVSIVFPNGTEQWFDIRKMKMPK